MSEQKKGFHRNILTAPVELRPCMSCGKPAELLKFNRHIDGYSVWCSDSDCPSKDSFHDTPEEACASWNSLADEFSKTFSVKLHPCHVCGRQPVLLAENDDAFQYRCQCAEELSVGTGSFSTAERAAAEWNCINEPCGSPLLHIKVSGHSLASLLKPCPFCEGKPELHKCPNGPIGLDAQEEEGWFVRCLCDSGDTVAETVWQPTVRAAVDAWNTRAAKQQPFLLRQHVPFGLFCAGAFLFSVGAGFSSGAAGFFLSLGASVALSSLILAENVAESKEQA
jgi:hypothetical protein